MPVRLVNYYSAEVRDRPGEGASALRHLKKAGVNLLAFQAFPKGGGRAQVAFVPSNPTAFKAAARAAGWRITGPKKAFVLQGTDRVGALVGYAAKLGEAKINVTAVSAAAAGSGRFGAILWVKQRDVKRARKVLGAG